MSSGFKKRHQINATPRRLKYFANLLLAIGGVFLFALAGITAPAWAQDQKKPNIMFIMGDDIGWMQPSIYHRGLMGG